MAIDMMGFLSGYLLLSIMQDHGFVIEKDGGSCLKITRLSPSNIEKKEESNSPTKPLNKKKCCKIALAIFASAIVIIFFAERFPSSSNHTNAEPIVSTDKVLSALSNTELGYEKTAQAIASLRTISIDGKEVPSAWIDLSSDGTMHSTARIVNYSSWLTPDEELAIGVSLGILETVNGAEVLHGVPIVLTKETELEINGYESDLSNFATIVLGDAPLYEIKADYTLHDDWLCAQKVSASSKTLERDIMYSFNWDAYSRHQEEAAIAPETHWLDIRKDSCTTVEGYIDMVVEEYADNSNNNEKSDMANNNYCVFRALDKLGDVPICHVATIVLENNKAPELNQSISLNGTWQSLQIILKDDGIVSPDLA